MLTKRLENLKQSIIKHLKFYDIKKDSETGQAMLITDTITNKSNWIYFNNGKFKIYHTVYNKIEFDAAMSILDFIKNNGI